MQSSPTRIMTAEATSEIMSSVFMPPSHLVIIIAGMPPAQRLNNPRPKQLYRKRMLRMKKPIRHSIRTMISPDSPMQPGIRYRSNIPRFCRFSSSLPSQQQKPANPMQLMPTIRFRALRMQVTSDRWFFPFFDSLETFAYLASPSYTPIFIGSSCLRLDLLTSFFSSPSSPSFGQSFSIRQYFRYLIQKYDIAHSNTIHPQTQPLPPQQLKVLLHTAHLFWQYPSPKLYFQLLSSANKQVIVLMEFQTDKPILFFDQGEDLEAADAGGRGGGSRQHSKQQGRSASIVGKHVAKMETGEGRAEVGDYFGKEMGQDKGREVPLYQMDFGGNEEEEYESKTQELDVEVFVQHPNPKLGNENEKAVSVSADNEEKQSESSSKLQGTSSKYPQSRRRRRNQGSKVSDIAPEVPNIKDTHKIQQKTEKQFEARNINKGFFSMQEEPDEYQKVMVGKRIPSTEESKLEIEPLQIVRNTKRQTNEQNRKLPTIAGPSRQAEDKPEMNQSAFSYANDSSLACLDKAAKQGRQIGDNNQKLEQIQYQDNDGDSLSLALRVVPKRSILKCLFRRQKVCILNPHPQYSLFQENGRFLLTAKKQWGHLNSHYSLSCEQKSYSDEGRHYAGYLHGNFTGTCFNIYAKARPNIELAATICYKPEIKCSSNFRSIEIYIKSQNFAYSQLEGATGSYGQDLRELYGLGQNASERRIIKLINKTPEWSERHQHYLMSFRGKSKHPSVKNMILVEESDKTKEGLLFCKTDTNQFYMEVSYPLNPVVAFGTVLTSFDFKLLCE